MNDRNIGLIGYGAIAREIVSRSSQSEPRTRFTILRRMPDQETPEIASICHVSGIDALIATGPDLVVEAAGHQAVAHLVPRLLRSGISVVAVSVGSLMQESQGVSLVERLRRCGEAGGARLILPAGAIGGLDYLSAVASLPDLQIVYTSRKPPSAWRDELLARDILEGDVATEILVFEGSVREAARLYPRNLNVAATLALAVDDASRIKVRVVIDPHAKGNMHEISIQSAAGRACFQLVNTPSAGNPKTSMVTALSVIHSIESFFQSRPHRPPWNGISSDGRR